MVRAVSRRVRAAVAWLTSTDGSLPQNYEEQWGKGKIQYYSHVGDGSNF
jgi:hypothetical protein